MFKKLHIRITSVREKVVRIKITEQSHRCDDFSYTGDTFNESNPIRICSMANPAFANDMLYVKGSLERRDSHVVMIPCTQFNDVLGAVLSYNEAFNKNKLELNDVVENLKLWERRNV